MIEQLLNEFNMVGYPFLVTLAISMLIISMLVISITINLGLGYKHLKLKKRNEILESKADHFSYLSLDLRHENQKLSDEIKKLKQSVKVKK
jgi:hypothetical protein